MYCKFFFHRIVVTLSLLITAIITWKAGTSAFAGNDKVVLFFNHPATGKLYLTAVYNDGSFYLPLTELLSILDIHYEQSKNHNIIGGTWFNSGERWEINIQTLNASVGRKKIVFSGDEVCLGEIDIYLSPDLFKRLFGLRFTVNMSSLNLMLESDEFLPAEEWQTRKLRQSNLERSKDEGADYKMVYPRERKAAEFGIMDYNLGVLKSNSTNSINYDFTGGMEFLGGDLKGTLAGGFGREKNICRAQNFIWRYVPENNRFLTSLKAGRMMIKGLPKGRFAGFELSNEPVIPRRYFNDHIIEGNTMPGSEVELYINDRLTDFTLSDEAGYYKFGFPLTYGTVRICLRIYKPSGEIIMKNSRIEIPFTFLPVGEVSYNLQGGVVENNYVRPDFDSYMLHGDIAWGIAGNITAKIGMDYLSGHCDPVYYGAISARVFDNYLLDLNIAPGEHLRSEAYVTYASGSRIKLRFAWYNREAVYNWGKSRKNTYAGFFWPFQLLGISSGFRFATKRDFYDNGSIINSRLGLSSRLRRFTLRIDYQDKFARGLSFSGYYSSLLTAAASCSFSRRTSLPGFLRGVFIRARTHYDLFKGHFNHPALHISRTIAGRGRVNLNLGYDLIGNSMYLRAGFAFDLPSFRSVTRFSHINDDNILRKNISGSIAIDPSTKKVIPSNRQQAGRSGVSVLMFLDTNENGHYEENERIIPSKAIRLDQAARMELDEDGILWISRLMSYREYKAEVIQESLPDPMLAPRQSKFSFIADPNRYKRMEIPLYNTGVLEGKVIINKPDNDHAPGGIRLIIKGIDRKYEKVIRTFSDGTFYCMGILPGNYTLEVDPVQLRLLNAESVPRCAEFKVKAMAGGDFLERSIRISIKE